MMEFWSALNKPKPCGLQRGGWRFIGGNLASIWSLRDLPVEVPEKLTKIGGSRLESNSPRC